MICDIDLRQLAWQYHADSHPGEENARTQVLHASVRAADFAHLTGSTSRSKTPTGSELSEKQKAWRTGIFATAKRYLGDNRAALDALRCRVHILRVVPTLALHHTMACHLFDFLSSVNQKCVKALQMWYFEKLSPLQAKHSQYQFTQANGWDPKTLCGWGFGGPGSSIYSQGPLVPHSRKRLSTDAD